MYLIYLSLLHYDVQYKNHTFCPESIGLLPVSQIRASKKRPRLFDGRRAIKQPTLLKSEMFTHFPYLDIQSLGLEYCHSCN